ncbi:MAG: Plug domain-containing protein [Gemmatimonadetes bacterium]|nr:Plug domain-containing protein [Gemmatimonadota bacterium]
MITTRRSLRLAAALVIITSPALAQEQETPPDTARVAEPEAPDSAAPQRLILPMPTPQTPSGPLPAGSRLTFTRDSLAWTSGYTLADLLGEIPGVYVARAGFVGQPEPVTYAGRGTAAIEIFWDGVPFEPIGPDSVTVDPGRISLFLLRRVEIEVLPAGLRVYLVSERHEVASTRSVVRIVSGDFRTAAYAGLFQHRWPNGIGVHLGAGFLGTEGARDPRRDANWLDLWLKGEWTPTSRTTAVFQVRRQSYERDPFGANGDLVPGRAGLRTDALLRFTAASGAGRTGLWFDAGLATTAWRPDSASPDTLVAPRTFRRVFTGLGYRNHNTTIEVRGRVGDYFTTAAAEAQLGWVPLGGMVLSANGSWARHRGERTSRRGRAVLGIYRGPFSLSAEVAAQDAVPAPALFADTNRVTTDYGIRAGIESRYLSGRVGLFDRDAFAPVPLTFFRVASLRPSVRTRYLVTNLTLRIGALALAGWYSTPTDGPAADFQPPKHGRATLTFRSKFLRTFRSGAFDLKVQLAMESWSTGTAGLDADGAEVPLIGATFYEAFLQFQLVTFRAFYSLKNAYNSREQFVPGLEYPRNIQTFGVKWVFTN